MLFFEIMQSSDGVHGHLAAYHFWNGLFELLQQLVKASCHQLHANPNVRVGNETA